MSILNQIAYSGVRASQVALASTGQNIANVNTPGFSRLQTVTGSLAGQGGLSVGGGVEVISIRRMTNDFHNQQLWRATTEENFYGASQQYLTALEALMSGTGSSISAGLDQFFAALSEASATPGSIALRQQIISEASTALRDHRESLVGQLSQFAKLRIHEVPDGSLSVALANGQPLVAGPTAGQLAVAMTATGEQEVSLAFAGTSFPLRQDGFGGAFGGLHDVEYNSLRPNLDALHDMASQLAQMVNDVLATGFDLDGNPGQPLFVYDPASTTALLRIEPLTAEQLAFSSTAGETGNNEVLLDLLGLKNQTITLNGSQVTLNDAYAGLLGQVASDSRQNQADLKSATAVTQQAQAQRDSVSAVSLDEEAVNLMTYQQAYQANMKVISTANQLFDDMLSAF